ncbi:MAG: NOL1/NOP2/sun family putative RNA methylase [Candidatus Helarchaeota archaeon]
MNFEELAHKFGYQQYMIERYFEMFGKNETYNLLKANEKRLYHSFRINHNEINEDKLIIRLKEKGFKLKRVPNIVGAYQVIYQPFSLGSTTEYLQGYYFIQRLSSMLPPIILNPNDDELVLDMCAAPGGKTIHLSNIMNNNGNIIALEDDSRRIKSLISNLRRCRVKNVIVLKKDARTLKSINKKFDKILLDAPCTGEGLIIHDRSRKQSRSMKDIKIMSNIQKSLLNEGISYLKNGGILIYSTCSIAPEENEFVIDDVIKNHSIQIETIKSTFGSPGITRIFNRELDPELKKAIRLYPHKDGMEGFFICKMKKK